MEADFIREVTYTSWLANVVMMKKASSQWRMCTNFNDLNKACQKDVYSLPRIDSLVDGASGHQIPMYYTGRDNTTFITERVNFCYEVMPFSLKNARATYQRIMDKIFHHQIRRCMELYVNDMVVRNSSVIDHVRDLKEVFAQVCKFQMR